MQLNVNQREIAIGRKYDIYNGQTPIRFAHSKLMRFLTRIDLCNIEGGQTLLTVARRFSFFRITYDIQFPGGHFAPFRTISMWRGHYQCRHNGNIYDVYSHHNRRHSVYRNGSQVAWWEQAAVSWFNGDNYKILADDDCEQDIIIALCLITDDSTSRNVNSNTLTLHVGHIGPEAKEFNPLWEPSVSSGNRMA